MPRFFVSPEALAEDTVTLTGEDCRHIALSLRMAVGDTVTLSDGEGREALCRLCRITTDCVEVEVLSRAEGNGELPVSVFLYQGMPKGDKLELIVQKAVELGAAEILPFESCRCVTRIRAERTAKQTERLSRVAREAAGQCGRSRLPAVREPLSFSAALADARARADLLLFCYEAEQEKSLKKTLEQAKAQGIARIALFVGSEGGFSPEEAAAAVAAGAVSVTLGTRILRCETAPMFALSCIVYTYEL
ncbi:MAG: 16S rRNA (uracil(1498)-N(3))-methyltransferase [Clostridia bacterium]|nr:16S rRNA (uracil(1498)-N(3))-methyltransferase [Clostridia bacterium]